jgi:hypothetical protein
MGKIPKNPFVGAHLEPAMMFVTPTLWKSGRPSKRIKMKMRKRKKSEDRAKRISTHRTKVSFDMAPLVMEAHQSLSLQDPLAVLR